MFPFQPYFQLNARKGLRGVVTERHGEVIFRKLHQKRALALWLKAFEYLHLTREGAKHFFGDNTEEERTKLLALCTTTDEVEAMVKAGPAHAALKSAAVERLRELGLEPEEAAPKKEGTNSGPRKGARR